MSSTDLLLFALYCAALVGGIVGMVKPALIKLRSRLAALGLFLSSFVVAAIGAALAPGTKDGAAMVVVMLIVVAMLMLVAWGCRSLWRSLRRKMATNTRQVTADGSEKVVSVDIDQQVAALAEGVAKVTREIEAHRRMAEALRRADSSRANEPDPVLSKAAVPHPATVAPVQRTTPKIQPDRAGKPKSKTGKWVEFTYVDADGEITDRSIRNWSRTSQYLEGYCEERRAVRTFRIDRIIEWGAWG